MTSPRRLWTRVKAVAEAAARGEDIPDELIPKICSDPVFIMICEACQHVKKRKPRKRKDGWCDICEDYHEDED